MIGPCDDVNERSSGQRRRTYQLVNRAMQFPLARAWRWKRPSHLKSVWTREWAQRLSRYSRRDEMWATSRLSTRWFAVAVPAGLALCSLCC